MPLPNAEQGGQAVANSNSSANTAISSSTSTTNSNVYHPSYTFFSSPPIPKYKHHFIIPKNLLSLDGDQLKNLADRYPGVKFYYAQTPIGTLQLLRLNLITPFLLLPLDTSAQWQELSIFAKNNNITVGSISLTSEDVIEQVKRAITLLLAAHDRNLLSTIRPLAGYAGGL